MVEDTNDYTLESLPDAVQGADLLPETEADHE